MSIPELLQPNFLDDVYEAINDYDSFEFGEECHNSFYYFFCEFWETITQDELKLNWHIEYTCDQLQKVWERFENDEDALDLIENLPPGSTKSAITSRLFPVWIWLRKPSAVVITASYSQTLSTGMALKSRDVINSEKFQRKIQPWFAKKHGNCLELKKDKNNKQSYENNFTGERISTSVGGTITGQHGHIIIIDDPIKPEDAESEVVRESTNKWLKETLPTRKRDRDTVPTILVMQRLHELDPTNLFLQFKTPKKHICLPSVESEYINPPELSKFYKDGLFDSIRLKRKTLDKMEARMSPRSFNAQFGQNPLPAKGEIWEYEWFQFYRIQELPKNVIWHFYIDTAYGTTKAGKKTGDYCAILPYCVYKNNVYFGPMYYKKVKQPIFEEELESFVLENGYSDKSTIKIEPKANGISTVDNLNARTSLNIMKDVSKVLQTDSKVVRADAQSAFIMSGRVFLLESCPIVKTKIFKDNVNAFPNGENDEVIDVSEGAIRNARNLIKKGEKVNSVGAVYIRGL